MICRRYGEILDDAAPADDAKFVLLQNELVNHAENLFVFVLHPEVEATNNRSERQARAEAMARKAARTSKTKSGARRRGVIMSVLASLSKRIEHFTLGSPVGGNQSLDRNGTIHLPGRTRLASSGNTRSR